MQIWQFAVIGLMFLVNGFFAMSELAIVSARRARLQALADQGVRGASRALKLTENPTGFLSTVQVGITLVGIFAGAYSGTTLSEPLADRLREIPALEGSADGLAIVLVVVAVTYFSLIIGELVPKRIAMANAERIASFVATPMAVLSTAGAPIVWFLSASTETVLRLLRVRRIAQSTITEEEVRAMVAEGTESGVFHPAERELIEGVIKVADRSLRSIIVPRPDVMWVDVEDDPDDIMKEILQSGHSRFPASRGEVDEVVGVVHVKDLLEQMNRTGKFDIEAALREPLFVNEHMPVLRLLDQFRNSAIHMAIVLDEHGSFEGIVTPTDILTSIAGDLPEDEGEDEPDAFERKDGSWLLSGRMPIDDAEQALALAGMNTDADFHTLAGFVLHRLGHIPVIGETFEWEGWRFEIVDLDGRRIDKVEARRVTSPEEAIGG